MTEAVERETGILGIAPTVVDRVAECPDPVKLLLIAHDGADAPVVVSELDDDLNVATSNPTYIEVTPQA